ncbi:MAG: long-chain-fatty-acid--CoA ligase [Desulfobacter postgatei]|uniref:Long-chain-fatty-acid--CoA ligase n=1 Tax=Desulfobacter postgatei TaxID=2293 RepID=A0A2G6MU07_9BACT|nr:MAG: long-chain-fatty-acid--CoA ligase [Desulfobacter postgatei]
MVDQTNQANISASPWNTPFWPEGVAHNVTGYHYPAFKLLDNSAARYPNQTFTIFNGAQKTFSQVKDTADRIAYFLAKKGIKKGDKVAILLPNLPHFPEIFFGIIKAGAVAMPCNPMYTATELKQQFDDSTAKMVFCMDHPTFYPNTVKAIEDTGVQTVVVCNVKSYLPKWQGFLGGLLGKIPKASHHEPGHIMFDDMVAQSRPEPPDITIDPVNDTAVMLYTGGTTGIPKGVELVHINMTYQVVAIMEYLMLSHGEGKPKEKAYYGGYHCYLGILPWYHSFGISAGMLCAAGSGSRLVCIPDPRTGNPPFTDVLKAVQKYRPTLMPAVPTIFVAFTNHPKLDAYDLSSLMGCFSGGAPIPPDVCRKFEAKTGAIIFEGYGLTETAPVLSVNPTNRETRKIGSIGFPIPGTDIKILDLDNPAKELPKGEDGEVAACGPQVMKGYWNNPEANAEAFVTIEGKRYFLTGDIGHIDKDGYILITDRKKEMIITGGFNVYPREVEDIIYTHSKVELCAVVGVENKHSGETVKAIIKLKEGQTATQEEFIAFCKENMAGYKRPRIIEFKDDIPVSNIGKVLRREVRNTHSD